MSKQRDAFWDIVKGVTILIVIFGHQLQNSSGAAGDVSNVFMDDVLFKSLYSFHMPLFMLISGYFFYYTANKYQTEEIIKNKTRQLVLPIATITLVLFVVNWDFSLKLLLTKFLTNLWFLWSVFYLSIFVLLVNKYAKDSVWVYIFCFLLTFIVPTIFIAPRIMYMYPFFVVGYLINKFGVFGYVFNNNKWMWGSALVLTIVFIALLIPFSRDTYIYITGYQILNRGGQFWIDIHRMIIGFCGSFLVIIIIRLLFELLSGRQKCIENGLEYLGRNTMQLYIISTLPFFHQLVWLFAKDDVNYLLATIATICVTLISILIIEVLKRVRLMNLLFFGQKINKNNR